MNGKKNINANFRNRIIISKPIFKNQKQNKMKKQAIERVESLFNEQKFKVEGTFPSIYSKDDVISLLSSLKIQVMIAMDTDIVEHNSIDVPVDRIVSAVVEKLNEMSNYIAEEIENCDDQLDDDDIVDKNSASFSMRYNTVELDDIDINYSEISSVYKKNIKELANVFIDEYKDQVEQEQSENQNA